MHYIENVTVLNKAGNFTDPLESAQQYMDTENRYGQLLVDTEKCALS